MENPFRKKMLRLSLILVYLLGMSLQAAAQAPLLGMNVEGTALISNNDIARAREQAVRNALEKAISQAVLKMLTDRDAEDRYQPVKSIVIGESDKYINYYKILSEARGAQDYGVAVNALVDLSVLKSDLVELDVLPEEGMTISTVKIFHRNLENYSQYDGFRRFLQSRPRIVKQLRPGQMAWGQAVFEAQVYGDPAGLVDELNNTGRYLIEVSRKEDRIVEIFLRDRGASDD